MKLGVVRLLLILLMLGVFQRAHATPAELAHEAFKDKDFIKAGQYYEQAYNEENVEVYLENAITAYLNYSFDCLNEKDYSECIKYCEKVLLISSTDKNAKEILSDAYYSRSSKYFYRGFKRKSEQDILKSFRYSVLPEQKERAKNFLVKISGKKYSQNPVAKKVSNRSSAPELIEAMELKIYGETFEETSVIDRVGKLEKDVLGRSYSNYSLIERVDNLKKRILPELMGQKS